MSVEMAASVLCVAVLGAVKLKPRTRFLLMGVGFITSGVFYILAYLATGFSLMCVMMFLGSLGNCAGNTIFNASMMLALPEENRGAILGFISAAATGGCALSAVIFGVLGDVFPLYLVFVVGTVLSTGPMLYLCCHRTTKEFILEH